VLVRAHIRSSPTWLSLTAYALPTTPTWQVLGNTANTSTGQDLATGDVDGDGYLDLLVSTPGQCKLDVYAGGSSGPSVTPLSTVSGPCFDAFAFAIAVAGDTNGDGYDDVLVGSPDYDSGGNQVMEGRVSLFLGGPLGLSASSSWDFESNQPSVRLGESLAGVGDLDGDGYDDFVLGAPYASSAGFVLLFLGGPTGPGSAPDPPIEGGPSDGLGAWLAPAGDVNGDGAPDLAAGGSGGTASVFAGGPGGVDPVPLWTVSGTPWSFGVVLGPGDLDGDGYDDLVVGAPLESSVYDAEGAVYVYPGSAAGPALAPTVTLHGGQDQAWFGVGLAGGDVDGDWLADVLVGSPRWGGLGGLEEGQIQLFFGTSAGLSATPAWTAYGGDPAWLGNAVVLADLDGDGRAEPAAGAPVLDARAGGAFAWIGVDVDGDGCGLPDDCDDDDVAINPDAEDTLEDGIDQDCDGQDAVFADTSDTGTPADTGDSPVPDTGEPGLPAEDKIDEDGGCGCAATGSISAPWVGWLAAGLLRRRKRTE
jgi:uncharacterized protein (TIGR03382 family)